MLDGRFGSPVLSHLYLITKGTDIIITNEIWLQILRITKVVGPLRVVLKK